MIKKAALVIVGGALILAGITARARRRAQPRKVLAIGDSLTASVIYCSSLRDQLPLGSTLTCRGLPGRGTGPIKDALIKHLKLGTTDVVILAGVNDLASRRKMETVKQNLDAMYKFASKQGARVVAVTLTPWQGNPVGRSLDAETLELNNWIRNHSIPDSVVDTSPLGDFQGRLLSHYSAPDGLHLTRAGSAELARLVYTQGF